MDQTTPKGFVSVMNSRVEEATSLDDFPSPPWAVRALIEHVIWRSAREDLKHMVAWEPACGRRIMSDVLEEYFHTVYATDVANYEDDRSLPPDLIDSYLEMQPPAPHHWMITNPPFNLALEFVLKALGEARQGVAILVRSNWIESLTRYERLFSIRPPTIIAPFVERVPMVKGRWDPTASTATSYSWFVWDTETISSDTRVKWIPPGCRKGLTHQDDVARFSYRGLP